MRTIEAIKAGEQIYSTYGHGINNEELLRRYGFVIDNEPQEYIMGIDFDVMKNSCYTLNHKTNCDLILPNWPNYNSTRLSQRPFVFRKGEIEKQFQFFFKTYEDTFGRRAEVLIIAALRYMLENESFTYSELNYNQIKMVENTNL